MPDWLIKLGVGKPVTVIIQELQDSNPKVREAAAHVIMFKQWDARFLPALVKALRTDSDNNIRGKVAFILGVVGIKSAIPALTKTIETDRDTGVCWSATRALERLK